jgi:hypothetical protein
MLASHVLDQFDVFESRLPICTDADANRTPLIAVREGLRAAGEADSRSRVRSEGVRCFRGTLVALGLEAVMVLGVYGIWQAWHLLR